MNSKSRRAALPTRALESRLHGIVDTSPVEAYGPRLSAAAQEVLEVAWHESVARGQGAPVDSADLLIGLLQYPRTERVLAYVGISEDEVRRAKRSADGYEVALRFGKVTEQRPTKTQQVARIGRLLAVSALASESGVVGPEDILEVVAQDKLGWGIHILEALGVDDLPVRDLLAANLPPVRKAVSPQEPGLLGALRRKVRQLRSMAPRRHEPGSWRAAGGLRLD